MAKRKKPYSAQEKKKRREELRRGKTPGVVGP